MVSPSCVSLSLTEKENKLFMNQGWIYFTSKKGRLVMMIFLKTKVDQKKDFQGGLRIPSAIKKYHVSQRGPKGSITSEILIAILDTLDVIGCIDRTDGLKLFLLVDGHGSRFQTDCLRYVIEPTHEWAVCINVPYSTTMW